MGPTVLLQHTEESGRSHYDWLLAPDDEQHEPDDRVLVHFRMEDCPDQATVGQVIDATRGEPHRWRYLDFEGEVSGKRGTVERIATGRCRLKGIDGDEVSIEVDWGRGLDLWRCIRIEGDRWRLERHG